MPLNPINYHVETQLAELPGSAPRGKEEDCFHSDLSKPSFEIHMPSIISEESVRRQALGGCLWSGELVVAMVFVRVHWVR